MIRRKSQSGLLQDRKFRLFGTVALILVTMFAALGFQLWQGYQDTLTLARSLTGNFASVTEAALDSALRLADVELQQIVRDFPVPALKPGSVHRYAEQLEQRLELRKSNFPEIRAFRVFDRDGDLIYSSQSVRASTFNVSDRAYFHRLKEANLPGPLFEVADARSGGGWILIVSRSLQDARGEFAGVVVAAIEVRFFQELFKSMHLVGRDVVSVYSTEDLSGVMRWPETSKPRNKLPETTPVAKALRAGEKRGSVSVKSAADGVDRIYSFKVLEKYPFVVLCGLSQQDFFEDWRTRAASVSVVAVVLALILVGLVYSLWQARLRSVDLADEKIRSEARTRRILDTALDAVVLSDTRGVVVGWNAKAVELFGYGPGEALGRQVSDLIVPSVARDAHEQGFANAVRRPDIGPGGVRLEMTARRADGTEFPVEMAVSSAGEGDDRLFAAFLHDIGPRRERELALNEMRDYLQALLEVLPDGVIVHHQGIVEYSNLEAEKILGSNLKGRSMFEFCQSQAVEPVRERFAALYRGEQVEGRHELPAISGTGAPIFIEASSVLVMQSSEPRILTVFRDTTERKRQEQALKQSEVRLRQVIDLIPNVIRAKDYEGRYLLTNRAHSQLYNLTESGMNGLVGPPPGRSAEETARSITLDAKARSSSMPVSGPEYRVLPGTGEERIFLTTRVTFGPDTGWPGAVLAVGTDITDLIRAQEGVAKLNEELELRVEERTRDLKLALSDLETFNYSVSHDLRAPLRAVTGFVGVTLDEFHDQVGPDARMYLEKARRSARSMSDIVDGLLSLAQMSREPMVRAPVALSDLARSVFEELDTDPSRRIEFSSKETPVARVDPKQMRVVIQNLLANAIKYSRGKNPSKITFESEMKDGEVVYVVSDNGAGFDSKHAENLFKPFGRLHSARDFEGTGIGLATVHRIVERHGGRIWAEAKVGEGATFRFTLGGAD